MCRLDALDKDDIEVIRQQRIAEMKKRASKKQEWMANVSKIDSLIIK